MDETDAAAVARARTGDGDAFRVLVERHGRSVFRLAFRMTGNEQDAEDVVQETFLRAYRQLHRYESRSSFRTWLYRIASNYSLDLLRSRNRDPDTSVNHDSMDPVDFVAGTDPAPDRVVFSGQIQQKVNLALEELTPQERTAFVLRHFEGLSIEEIGQALGTGTNATKHSVFRAVQKLRKALEPLVTPAALSQAPPILGES